MGANIKWAVFDNNDNILRQNIVPDESSDLEISLKQRKVVMDMDAADGGMTLGGNFNILPKTEGVKFAFLIKTNTNQVYTGGKLHIGFVKNYTI